MTTRPHIPHALRSIAATVIGCYLALGFLVFLCGSLHTHDTGHHSPDPHSILCAWACQGTNSTSLISLPAPLTPFTQVISLTKEWGLAYYSSPRVIAFSRGPPSDVPLLTP